jgi:tetratricopeptide (TPR) repeat protein
MEWRTRTAKMKGKIIALLAVVLVIISAFSGFSQHQRNKARGEQAKRIFSLGGANPPSTVEELKAAIKEYEKRIERYVNDTAQTGMYWKLLASRLSDRGLHGEALEALGNAAYYLPVDPSVQYNTGLSAGIMAKSSHAFPGRENREKEEYFSLAEKAFLRAIELDDRYLSPRYALGVLYVFELDRSEDAIPHLKRYLEISRNDVDTMFVLARAYYVTRDYKAAVDLYDRIITLTMDEQKRKDAQNNRQLVLGQMNG